MDLALEELHVVFAFFEQECLLGLCYCMYLLTDDGKSAVGAGCEYLMMNCQKGVL